MSTQNQFSIEAQTRSDVGKANSRRTRRKGMVPAIIYGGKDEPVKLLVEHDDIYHHLENEAFYSHILTIKTDGKKEEMAILRALQRHPSKPTILHIDFLRVTADEKINVKVPLHFINQDTCIGVKQQGGIVSHLMNELEISCLPKDLPEFIEIDILELELGKSLHLSDIQLPEGVESAASIHGDEAADPAIVSVIKPKAIQEEEEKPEGEEGEAAEGEEGAEGAEAKEGGAEQADKDKDSEDSDKS